MSTATQKKSKLPELFSLILIVVLGIIGAKLMWLVITPKQLATNQAPSMSNSTVTSKEKINYGKLIANHHLFGEVVVKKASVVQTTKTEEPKVVPTKLNLKLHGIISYKQNSKKGYALISSSGKTQKVYGEGDELQKGVTVRNIFPDKVVLDNQGKSEELVLPIKDGKSSDNRRKKRAKTSKLTNGYTPPKPTKTTDLDLGVFRREVQKNPQKLLDIASPSPAIINGKFIGFRLQPGRKRKLFRQLGFRSNDIITEVNGIILDDSSKGPMVLGELAQASELSITLKRGSQEVFIQHSF